MGVEMKKCFLVTCVILLSNLTTGCSPEKDLMVKGSYQDQIRHLETYDCFDNFKAVSIQAKKDGKAHKVFNPSEDLFSCLEKVVGLASYFDIKSELGGRAASVVRDDHSGEIHLFVHYIADNK